VHSVKPAPVCGQTTGAVFMHGEVKAELHAMPCVIVKEQSDAADGIFLL